MVPTSSRLLHWCPRAAAALLLLASVACAASAAREPYTNAFATKEAVADAFVEALAARDAGRLAAMALTEIEFRKNIWPELPASRPEVGMPFDYLWAETAMKNRGYLANLLAEYGGRHFDVTDVAFGGTPTDYGTFRIHPETRLTVADDTGATSTVRLFGSMVEAYGQWKIYSFVVD